LRIFTIISEKVITLLSVFPTVKRDFSFLTSRRVCPDEEDGVDAVGIDHNTNTLTYDF